VDPAADFARDVWKALSDQTGAILGDTVRFSAPEVTRELAFPERAYVARLEADDGSAAFVVLAIEPAIAAASLMLERPKTGIEARLAAAALEGDDIDALGELVSQLAAPLNAAIEMQSGAALHFAFKTGSADGAELPVSDAHVVVQMSFNPGELAEGIMLIAVPDRVLSREAAPEIDASPGFDLTPEEVAALREATREAARGGIGKTLVIVPIARDHAQWKELLDRAGIAHEIAGDVLGSLGSLRAGEYDAVIVDADSSPAGGLPTLARIRAAASGVPAIIVASFPTRTHLIGCLAAGVRRYVTKPVDLQALMLDLGGMAR
jgi:CheY-like chemotaxis protein